MKKKKMLDLIFNTKLVIFSDLRIWIPHNAMDPLRCCTAYAVVHVPNNTLVFSQSTITYNLIAVKINSQLMFDCFYFAVKFIVA